MYHLIYCSQAQEGLTLTALVVLLMQARSLNERNHVTGALVYGDGQFLPVLEGEAAEVQKLYTRIQRDKRHHDVRKLAEGPIAQRSFAQWSMAFGEVPAADFQGLQQVAGYQTPAQLANQLASGPAAADPLLAKLSALVFTHAKG